MGVHHHVGDWQVVWVWGGATKGPFDFSIEEIFDFAKLYVRLFESLSYLMGITATELQ